MSEAIAVSTTYAEWVSEANDIIDDEDAGKWRLGDLACQVKDDARYGDKAMADFASDIRRPGRTVRLYQEMSAFWPSGTRCQFPMFSRQHYREAMRVDDLELAIELLEVATDENWQIQTLTDAVHDILGKPPVKRALLEVEIVGDAGYMAFTWDGIEDGKRYLVKVYEANE